MVPSQFVSVHLKKSQSGLRISPKSSACAVPACLGDGCLLSHGSAVQFGVTHTTGGCDGNFPTGFGMLPCHSRVCAADALSTDSAAIPDKSSFFILISMVAAHTAPPSGPAITLAAQAHSFVAGKLSYRAPVARHVVASGLILVRRRKPRWIAARETLFLVTPKCAAMSLTRSPAL